MPQSCPQIEAETAHEHAVGICARARHLLRRARIRVRYRSVSLSIALKRLKAPCATWLDVASQHSHRAWGSGSADRRGLPTRGSERQTSSQPRTVLRRQFVNCANSPVCQKSLCSNIRRVLRFCGTTFQDHSCGALRAFLAAIAAIILGRTHRPSLPLMHRRCPKIWATTCRHVADTRNKDGPSAGIGPPPVTPHHRWHCGPWREWCVAARCDNS